jgi:hypothetical protein
MSSSQDQALNPRRNAAEPPVFEKLAVIAGIYPARSPLVDDWKAEAGEDFSNGRCGRA